MNPENTIVAADTVRLQSGGQSMFQQGAEAALYGGGAALLSGLTSLANSAISVGNMLGTDIQELDNAKIIGDVDRDWANYYVQHREGIDTLGFVAASFVPGTLAVKGLRLAQAGKSVGAFRTALGYTVHKQEQLLQAGLAEIASTGGGVFARTNWYKLGSIAAGAGQAALETAVFETAAAITLQRSPFLEKEDFGDVAWDIAKTSLVGGVLGGAVTGLLTNKIFRDAGKLVEGVSRKYDSIATLQKTGMLFGDEAFSIVDEALKLPKTIAEMDQIVPFRYSLNGKETSIGLDVGNLLDKKASATYDKAMEMFRGAVTNVVKADPTVGEPLAAGLLQIVAKNSKDMPAARKAVGDLLFNLREAAGLYSDEAVDFSKQVVYVTPGVSITSENQLMAVFAGARATEKDHAFRISGPLEDVKVALVGTHAQSKASAFANHFDVFIDKSGRLEFNPNSKIFVPAQTADKDVKMIYNPHTQNLSESAIPTVADVATGSKKLNVTNSGVTAGNFNFEFNTRFDGERMTTVRQTARHVWADEFSNFTGKTIQPTDFSLLDRLYQQPALRKSEGLTINGETAAAWQGNYDSWLLHRKLEEAQKIFMNPETRDMDFRAVAARLNVEVKWLEAAQAAEFQAKSMQKVDGLSRDLKSWRVRENIVLTYDRQSLDHMTKAGFDPQSAVAYAQRVKEAQEHGQRAAAYVLGRDFDQFLVYSSEELLRKADQTGVGATAAGFANAGYEDKLRMFVQDTGRAVHLVGENWANAAASKIKGPAEALMADSAASKQLVALRTRLQMTPELMTLVTLPGGVPAIVDLASFRKFATMQGPDRLTFGFKQRIEVMPQVYDFLKAHHELHATQLDKRISLANAQGTPLHWDTDALYLPPIDTRRTPYFAFVRAKEGKLFGSQEVAMITARDADELQRLANGIPSDEFQVLFKADTEAFHKAAGDYDFSKALNQPSLDPFLRKQGRLGDYLPSFDVTAHVEDFLRYHANKGKDIVRESVQVLNAQLFNELQFLSGQATKAQTSQFSFLGKIAQRNVIDPFGDYVRTALDISKRGEYTLWSQMNEFVDAVGTRAYRAIETIHQDAQAKKMTWEEANQQMEALGIRGPFTGPEMFSAAQVGNDKNLIKEAIGKAHSILSNFGLRFDFVNSLIQIVSTPILTATEVSSIRRAVQGDSKLAGILADLETVRAPDGTPVPTTLKLMGNAVKNYFADSRGGKVLADRYKDIGAIRGLTQLHYDLLNDMSAWNQVGVKVWNSKLDKWTEKISTLTGNNFSEEFTRFVSADVMRQISQPLVDAGKMSGKEQNAVISIFTNRVQGNYISSQRPIMFQGTLGAALGLFQTYQFNLFQQVFRHIENRDARTLAVATAMQSGLFGLNGLPLFEAINTHLIGNASMNEGHKDIYSTVMSSVPKDIGEWMLYGTPSAFPMFSDKAPALYTRGDLNPRYASIVPVSPMDLPAVQLGQRVVSTISNFAKNLVNGADLSSAFLHGLEHNGVSRPLAGFAQVAQGYRTTADGSLVAINDLTGISSFTRLAGARPMDETIALNERYRLTAYKANDKQRIEDLGVVVKDKMRRGSLTEEDVHDVMSKFAAGGGRIEGFGQALQRWSRDASTSSVNTLMRAQRTSYGQRMMEVMGADPLDDFSSAPPAQRPSPAAGSSGQQP